MSRKYPAIPEPGNNIESIREAVVAMKQIVEGLARLRDPAKSAVTWDELIALGIWGVDADKVPKP